MITGTRICHLLSPEFHDCQARVAFTKILVKSLERKPHETTSPWKWKVKYTLSLYIYMYYIYVLCCCAVSCYLTLYHVNCCYFFVSIQHHADHFSKKKQTTQRNYRILRHHLLELLRSTSLNLRKGVLGDLEMFRGHLSQSCD